MLLLVQDMEVKSLYKLKNMVLDNEVVFVKMR